jgi:hypothetical protein
LDADFNPKEGLLVPVMDDMLNKARRPFAMTNIKRGVAIAFQ